MSVAGTMKRSLQSLSEFWAARNARERMLLAAAAAVIIFGLIYVVLINPALEGREQLSKNLPVLRQQVAQLQAMAKEAAGLAGQSQAAPTVAPVSRESVEAGLARKGLKAQNIALTGDIVKIQLSSVSFSALLDWLADIQKTSQLAVIDANIVALSQPDMVNVTLTLQ
jgi:general secretion pathway protein M